MVDVMGAYLVTTDQDEALSDVIPMTADLRYPGEFPGYVGAEDIHRPTQAFIPSVFPASIPWDTPTGNIDYTSWGTMGEVDRNAYSILGPVEPNSVENFQLFGQVLPGQRRPEYGDGVVGQYDHGAYTALSVAQQMATTAYDEASLVSLLLTGV
jgi:hypothetical protein